jgi:predicted RNase H-like nuclease (RuvC/YqgF family)
MQEQVTKLEIRQDRLEETVNRLVAQIDKLVGAFDRTYEADHKIDLTLQLLNAKVDAMQEAIKRGHGRTDEMEPRLTKLEHFKTQVWTYGSVVVLVVSPVIGLVVHKAAG